MTEHAAEVEVRLYEQGVDVWGLKREDASQLISERIEAIQKLYNEVMVLADAGVVTVWHTLSRPDGMRQSHNSSMYGDIYWSPSAARC